MYPTAFPAAPVAPGVTKPVTRSPRQWQAYIRVRIYDGCPLGQVLAELSASGLDQPSAFAYVAAARTQMLKRIQNNFMWGLISLVLGVVLVTAAWADMSKTGRSNILMWFFLLILVGVMALYAAYRGYTRLPSLPPR